jgi:spore coat polysaccharide biosynthesis protein SpsF
VPSDCPLIDPKIIDDVIRFYKNHTGDYDYVSNLHPASYPDGNDVELMTFPTLERAWRNSDKQLEKEHTTPYIWENPDRFRIGNVKWETDKDYSKLYRWTIDYPEDYDFIKEIYETLYHKNPKFSLNDILELLEQQPELIKINEKFAGEYWYKNHVNELKTITY